MLLTLCRADTDPLVECLPANCQALPDFVPYGSGGDGDLTQYCMFLSPFTVKSKSTMYGAMTHAPSLSLSSLPALVGYVGYDPKYFQAIVVGHQVSFTFDFPAVPLVLCLHDAKLC